MRRFLLIVPFVVVGCGPAVVTVTAPAPTLEVKATQGEAKPTGVDPEKINWEKVSAAELVRVWAENPSAADARYTGTPNGVEFAGTLVEITSNIHNQTLVYIAPEKGADRERQITIGVTSDKARASLNAFKINDVVRVRAVSYGRTDKTPHLLAYRFDKLN